MILLADSGSTKTDWCLVESGMVVKNVTTQGINPYHQDEMTINRIVFGELLPQIDGLHPYQIVFYGSGCRPEKVLVISKILTNAFDGNVMIEVNGDLLGTARAVCGNSEGIACILGTGSNSCLYNGTEIVENISPLGYILGDEGSGAALGKAFLNEMLKNRSLCDVRDEFFEVSRMNEGDIIERVYRQPQANRFLASLAPFVHAHLNNAIVRDVVIDNFRLFFQKNVERYSRPDLTVGFVGSIAWYFKDELAEAASAENICLGRIVKSPMDGLIEYHSSF